MLVNSVGTRCCDADSTFAGAGAGGGDGGGGSSFGAGAATSRAPLCVPTMSDVASGANATAQTLDAAFSGPSCSPRAAVSQSFTAPSMPPLTIREPSGEKASDVTQSLWPASVASGLPSAAAQSRRVRSAPLLAMVWPSGE